LIKSGTKRRLFDVNSEVLAFNDVLALQLDKISFIEDEEEIDEIFQEGISLLETNTKRLNSCLIIPNENLDNLCLMDYKRVLFPTTDSKFITLQFGPTLSNKRYEKWSFFISEIDKKTPVCIYCSIDNKDNSNIAKLLEECLELKVCNLSTIKSTQTLLYNLTYIL
jgi:hypothetical protein